MYFVISIQRIEKWYLLNFKTNAGYYYSTLGINRKDTKISDWTQFLLHERKGTQN